jgi:hypothetical protein
MDIEEHPRPMSGNASAQLSPKVTAKIEPSRAREREKGETASARARAGRKRVATPERLQSVCALIAAGQTEEGACRSCGISLTAWSTAKRASAGLREHVALAREERAKARHQQFLFARHESQLSRAAGRKALGPQPTRRAKWIVRYLATQVPLNHAAIPHEAILEACGRVSLTEDDWRRQEQAFGLLRKVYEQRAKIRGQQPVMVPTFSSYSPQVEDDPFDVFRA